MRFYFIVLRPTSTASRWSTTVPAKQTTTLISTLSFEDIIKVAWSAQQTEYYFIGRVRTVTDKRFWRYTCPSDKWYYFLISITVLHFAKMVLHFALLDFITSCVKVITFRVVITRAGTNTPSDEYDTYRDTGWRIRYVSRIHFFSEAKLGNGSNMAPPNGLFRISSYVVFVIVVQLS